MMFHSVGETVNWYTQILILNVCCFEAYIQLKINNPNFDLNIDFSIRNIIFISIKYEVSIVYYIDIGVIKEIAEYFGDFPDQIFLSRFWKTKKILNS